MRRSWPVIFLTSVAVFFKVLNVWASLELKAFLFFLLLAANKLNFFPLTGCSGGKLLLPFVYKSNYRITITTAFLNWPFYLFAWQNWELFKIIIKFWLLSFILSKLLQQEQLKQYFRDVKKPNLKVVGSISATTKFFHLFFV
jgi:hypothetical protein